MSPLDVRRLSDRFVSLTGCSETDDDFDLQKEIDFHVLGSSNINFLHEFL